MQEFWKEKVKKCSSAVDDYTTRKNIDNKLSTITYSVKRGALTDKYYFSNYISSNSCPAYIYNYFGTVSKFGGSIHHYYKWLPTKDTSYELDSGLLTTGSWYKLELKTDCKNGNTEEPSLDPTPTTCEGLISDNLRELINKIMTYIRIAVPILLVGLIIVDFATAIFAESDDKMKKAQSKVIKRIIIAIVIFFVPTLINLLFNIVNDVWVDAHYEICGLDK